MTSFIHSVCQVNRLDFHSMLTGKDQGHWLVLSFLMTTDRWTGDCGRIIDNFMGQVLPVPLSMNAPNFVGPNGKPRIAL